MNQAVISEFKTAGEKAVKHLEAEYAPLQAGKASSAMVDNIQVDSYGSMVPMKNVAQISLPSPTSLQIQPWDKSMLAIIEKAILEANIGITPSNNGVVIILNVPAPTEERRRELVKMAKNLAEEAKISVRQARTHAMDKIKAEDVSDDEKKGSENGLQKEVDAINKKIEEVAKAKEQDIMTI